MCRRDWLAGAAALATSLWAGDSLGADARPPIGLGFSLYGMRSLAPAEGLRICQEIGYDCVELPVMEGWPLDSTALTEAARRELAGALAASGLRLSALMENLPLLVDAAAREAQRRRISAAGELIHTLRADRPQRGPAILETVLGGKPSQWSEVRDELARRLDDWAHVAERSRLVLAIKAHVGGATHLPEHAAWLVERVGSPWVRCAYDYSHFWLRDVDLVDSVRTLAPLSVFAHVKDAKRLPQPTPGGEPRFEFLLPGEGEIDYPRLLRELVAQGYRGDVVVEVSGQIHGRPGYDPRAAAERSYSPLAKAFTAAEIERG